VFIALIAFLGLVIDGALLLARYAQLRRTVDAAAVQASNQFREFRPLYHENNAEGDMYSAVMQIAATQGFVPANSTFRVYACTASGPDVEAGPPQAPADYPAGIKAQLCTTPPRKLVRVDGSTRVDFVFLSVLGWRNVIVQATGVAEAAALDLVLVLDRSSSMASDSGVTALTCSPSKSCQPFEDVRTNAYRLVNKLYFPYDRVAIVTFSRRVLVYDHATSNFRQLSGITDTGFLSGTLMISDKAEALGVLNDNAKFNIDTCERGVGCTSNDMPGTGYTANTNTGGAIRVATSVLAVQGRMRGSVWMMLLLSDGSPNVTDSWSQFTGGFCPPNTWAKPSASTTYTVPGYIANTAPTFPYAHSWCRRTNVSDGGSGDDVELPYSQLSRVCLYVPPYPGGPLPKCGPGTTMTDTATIISTGNARYDAADYMRDQADYMANNGIVAFVIGLGSEVANSPKNWSTWKFISTGGTNQDPREPNAGERLLRYVADVGSQPNTWQCKSDYWTSGQTEFVNTTADHHCGNYWYAQSGSSLQPIFDAIANRIFTRITQ
jgi:hypothetical protein